MPKIVYVFCFVMLYIIGAGEFENPNDLYMAFGLLIFFPLFVAALMYYRKRVKENAYVIRR